MKNVLKGNIVIRAKLGLRQNKKLNIPYSFNFRSPGLHEILLSQFKHMAFDEDEKKLLTLDDRRNIFYLKNFSETEIYNKAQEIWNTLEQIPFSALEIEAEGPGAYCAITALSFRDQESMENIDFHFHNTPLSLIPKNILKLLDQFGPNVHFHFYRNSSNNLEKFSGLFLLPKNKMPTSCQILGPEKVRSKKIAA